MSVSKAFCDGHVSAFAFLGGVPQSILYDNSKIAVTVRICVSAEQASSRYGEEDVASARERSRSCSRTTCSATGSAESARATTRAVSKAWWDTAEGKLLMQLNGSADPEKQRRIGFDELNAHLFCDGQSECNWSVWTQGSGGTPRA